MAKLVDNIFGLRGKIGSLVFRRVRGETYVSAAPSKPRKGSQSALQRHNRDTFRMASQWAKATLSDPQQMDYYRRRAKDWGLTNAYTAAVKDYMRNPQVRVSSDERTSPQKIGLNAPHATQGDTMRKVEARRPSPRPELPAPAAPLHKATPLLKSSHNVATIKESIRLLREGDILGRGRLSSLLSWPREEN